MFETDSDLSQKSGQTMILERQQHQLFKPELPLA